MPARINSRLTARLEHSHVDALIAADDAAASIAAAAIDRVIDAILAAPSLDWMTAQSIAREWWPWLLRQLADEQAQALTRLAALAYERLRQAIIDHVPLATLRLANPFLMPEASLRIVQLQPDPTKQSAKEKVVHMLLPPLSRQQVAAVVRGLPATTPGIQPGQLGDVVARGTAAGKTRAEIARDLRQAFGATRVAAARAVRTYGAIVTHRARMEGYGLLGDAIAGYQLRAVIDRASRPWHAARNGKIYWKRPAAGQRGLNEMPNPPYEPPGVPWNGKLAWNCRCLLTPVFATGDAPPQVQVSGQTRSTAPDVETYQAWWGSASERQRRVAVGAQAYETLRRALKRRPEWRDFLDPATGEVMSAAALASETGRQRAARLRAIKKLLDLG